MNSVTFKIEGMHCDGCATRITTLLEKEAGVRDAAVSFADGEARVKYNPHTVREDRLIEVIEAGGFTVLADNHE